MPISFGETSGDSSNAYIRVNLPQNRWTLNAGGDPAEIDMVRGIAIDIAAVKFGWLKIAVGMRDWQEWPSPSQPLPKPTETDAEGKPAYKQGFDVDCWMSDGTKAQFSNNSYGTGQFIAKLYNQAETRQSLRRAWCRWSASRRPRLSWSARERHMIWASPYPSGLRNPQTARRPSRSRCQPQRHQYQA